MRFVQINDLKQGMILDRNLYGTKNELLLARGQVLSVSHINKIAQLDHEGVYISDGDEPKNELKGIISTRLKDNTVDAMRNLFGQIDKGDKSGLTYTFSRIRYLLDDIIDEISIDKNALVNMVDVKQFDDYTYYHSVNVAALSIMVGASAGFNRTKLYKLGLGALLHDIGKIFISKDIINKPGQLTREEFGLMKEHPQLGSEYLKRQWDMPIESNIAVLTHHERYDGKGYPLSLSENKQTIEGKIVCISDVYDALTSDRPYRRAVSPSEAIEHIMGNSETLFDPKVINFFIKKIIPYPVGTIVYLSNGLSGLVIENYVTNKTRPKLKILGTNETKTSDEIIYDLQNDHKLLNVTILGIKKQHE
ncbi:MAG: HD-GYP domain-containing protein [Eubacteriales bacterium]